ncbi:hypothetical protein VFPBJ_07946 [Purpureocillium lilacinum]|uniref:Uncharacterized protein n=1 Tax=Purpureocillium lilacinum TaxID=33203 RepID=A0A179GHX2_PURLI|nr:hypothetical protein VFPBJ_07946 [Purpureocillium lilacinum]
MLCSWTVGGPSAACGSLVSLAGVNAARPESYCGHGSTGDDRPAQNRLARLVKTHHHAIQQIKDGVEDASRQMSGRYRRVEVTTETADATGWTKGLT